MAKETRTVSDPVTTDVPPESTAVAVTGEVVEPEQPVDEGKAALLRTHETFIADAARDLADATQKGLGRIARSLNVIRAFDLWQSGLEPGTGKPWKSWTRYLTNVAENIGINGYTRVRLTQVCGEDMPDFLASGEAPEGYTDPAEKKRTSGAAGVSYVTLAAAAQTTLDGLDRFMDAWQGRAARVSDEKDADGNRIVNPALTELLARFTEDVAGYRDDLLAMSAEA